MAQTNIEAPLGLPFVTITRDVDAPRELVFRAYTEPALVKQWLGPRKYEMEIDVYDVRDGGRWRYVHTDGQNRYGFHGVFHGEPTMDAFVQTFEFEGAPGHVSLDRLSLEDLGDGRTRIHTHSAFESVEARDAMVTSGMGDGVRDAYDRLDEVLVGLQRPAPAGAR